MPKKICFNVVYASGEEEKYRASELDRHGPSVKGWQSSRDCNYPQELILKLGAPATLQQIQILAHQFLIPERIDLWIGPDEPGDEPSTFHFDYMGYITLSDNLNTEYKSRELKSITVPAFCPTLYVKLRLHQNHRNALNVYNQVSLVAVQLIGEPAETSENLQNENKNDHTANYSSTCDDLAFEMYVDKDVALNIRKLESRKFLAVQDERFEYARKLKTAMAELRLVGERLGKLEIGKKQAIQNEDYARAKKKKAQMDEYRKESYTALKLTELLEEDGLIAKNDEESPEANEIAKSAIVLQNNVINENNGQPVKLGGLPGLSPATLLPQPASSLPHPHHSSSIQQHRSQTTPGPGASQPSNSVQPSQSHQQHLNISDGRVSPALYQSPVSPLHYRAGASSPTGSTIVQTTRSAQSTIAPQPVRGGSLRRRNKSASLGSGSGPAAAPPAAARNSYEAYDERLVPAQRNLHAESTPPASTLHSSNSKLNERERKQAALPIDVFGMALVEKFYSKQYTDKEEGLRLLQAALRNYTRNACVKPPEHMEVHSPNKLARAAIFLLHRALRDKVFLVYSVAAEVIRYFFSEFVPGRVTMAEVAKSVDKILPELILKSGDTTPRIHNMAVHTILSMADTRDVRSLHVIPVHLTRVLTSSTHPRLAQSRLEMAEQLIINHGISSDKNSGMACRTLAEFGASGLHHPAEAVRKVAERVLLLVYKVNPRLVRKQLPPDDDITRRNLLYRNLMQQFDKIDQQRKGESNFATSSDKPKLVRSGSVTSTGTASVAAAAAAAAPPIRVASTGDFAQIMQSSNSKPPQLGSDSSSSEIPSPADEQQQQQQQQHGNCSRQQQCIFCLERRDDFTEEGLNIHYWKSCPMLTRCHHCQEVVEIASLNQHLVDDCDRRKQYIKCEFCGDAVLSDKREEHRGGCGGAGVVGLVSSRCPLCRSEVDQGTPANWWREHLTSLDRLCPNHPRRAYVRSAHSHGARSPESSDSARHSSLGQVNSGSIYGYC